MIARLRTEHNRFCFVLLGAHHSRAKGDSLAQGRKESTSVADGKAGGRSLRGTPGGMFSEETVRMPRQSTNPPERR